MGKNSLSCGERGSFLGRCSLPVGSPLVPFPTGVSPFPHQPTITLRTRPFFKVQLVGLSLSKSICDMSEFIDEAYGRNKSS